MILALANRVTRCAPVTKNFLPACISSLTERRRMELILCAFCINAWTSSVIYRETLSLSVVSRMMTSFIIQEGDVAAIFLSAQWERRGYKRQSHPNSVI